MSDRELHVELGWDGTARGRSVIAVPVDPLPSPEPYWGWAVVDDLRPDGG